MLAITMELDLTSIPLAICYFKAVKYCLYIYLKALMDLMAMIDRHN